MAGEETKLIGGTRARCLLIYFISIPTPGMEPPLPTPNPGTPLNPAWSMGSITLTRRKLPRYMGSIELNFYLAGLISSTYFWLKIGAEGF